MTGLAAVVFDFDGTLVDTEWSIYEMSAATFASFGIELTVPVWAAVVGLADGMWWEELCRVNGWQVDNEAWWDKYRSFDRSFRDSLPVVDGAIQLLDALAAAQVPLAVASSSTVDWVDGHLTRLGLRDRFVCVAGADRVGGVGKPAPDVYLLACAELGVEPGRCVAIEDTGHGIAAAHAAGLECVAVPTRITTHTDLTAADLTVSGLGDLSVSALSSLCTRNI